MKIPRMMVVTFVAVLLVFASGCGRPPAAEHSHSAATAPHAHEHTPPHGGTPVVLGDELYHLELVREVATGRLQAYVLDGEMENFIRLPMPAFTIEATFNGVVQTLVLSAVANAATGETAGDTALFETRADWLKNTPEFDAILKSITIRGTTFTEVKFNFPKGNDHD